MSETSAGILSRSAGSHLLDDRSASRGYRRRFGRAALAIADLFAITLAMLLAGGLMLVLGQAVAVYSPGVLVAAAALAALVPGLALGLHDSAGLDPLERFRLRVLVAAMIPWPTLALLALAGPVTIQSLVTIGLGAVFYLPLAALTEAGTRRALIAHAAWGADVVVIGCGDAAATLAAELLAQPAGGLRPVGYCGDRPERAAAPAIPRLGSCADAATLAGIADMAVVILSPGTRQLDLATLPFDRIVVVPEHGEIPAVALRARALGLTSGICFANPARARSHQRAKRLIDLAVALPALLLTLPLIGAAALAIRVVSPGPAFFVQPRVGWRGKTVGIFKLRSMHLDAGERLEHLLRTDPAARHEWETYVKLRDDPRILPLVGNFIRRTSIDELPQLWNVVRGDISLVGPRPFPHYHAERFSPDFQALRCAVRPGLTGLWQVSDRSGADLQQQEAIDTFYIRNWSFWLDFYIVFRTLPAVLNARGAR